MENNCNNNSKIKNGILGNRVKYAIITHELVYCQSGTYGTNNSP